MPLPGLPTAYRQRVCRSGRIPGPYEVFGNATEFVRTGDHGARFRFRFCPICGSNVFHTEDGHESEWVAVAIGAFADPDFPPPKDSVYDCRRHPWVKLPPEVTVYERDPP